MTYKQFCDSIFRLYLYSDSAKMVHYSTDSSHGHKLADDIRDSIIDHTDDIAEAYFGVFGKPSFGDMSIKQDIATESDLAKLCQRVLDTIKPIKSECEKNDKLSGILSIIDDMTGELNKFSFLATFDNISNRK